MQRVDEDWIQAALSAACERWARKTSSGTSSALNSFTLERKKWPGISENQIKTADGIMQREYRRKLQELRTRTKDDIDQGAVSATPLAVVEKAWETYRGAWVAFAHLRYPAAVEAIRAEITLRRYLLLKTI
jgi:hypothetical protein